MYIIIVSLFIHGLFFFVLRPHFNYYRQENQSLNWWGDFPYINKNRTRMQKKYNYDDFFLGHKKIGSFQMGKDVYEEERGFLKINTDQVLFKERDQRNPKVYTYLDRDSDFVSDTVIRNQVPGWEDVYPLDTVSIQLFISPTGRVIAIRSPDLKGHLFLRDNLDKELRTLIFPSKGDYYWRNVEVKLQ